MSSFVILLSILDSVEQDSILTVYLLEAFSSSLSSNGRFSNQNASQLSLYLSSACQPQPPVQLLQIQQCIETFHEMCNFAFMHMESGIILEEMNTVTAPRRFRFYDSWPFSTLICDRVACVTCLAF